MNIDKIERGWLEVLYGKAISDDPIFLFAPVLWLGLMVVNYLLFDRGRDAAFKRKWFPRSVVFNGVAFTLMATAGTVLEQRSLDGLWMLIIIAPGAFMVSLHLIPTTRFCDYCGSTVNSTDRFSPPRTCQNCGAILKDHFGGSDDRVD